MPLGGGFLEVAVLTLLSALLPSPIVAGAWADKDDRGAEPPPTAERSVEAEARDATTREHCGGHLAGSLL